MKRVKLVHKPVAVVLLIIFLLISGCSNTQPEINNIISNDQWAFENNGNEVNGKHATVDMDINYPEQSIYESVDYNKLPLIAIIDTGIDFSNSYLQNSAYVNINEKPDGIDNDSNGYVDDIYGVDIENDKGIVEREAKSNYHGSYIAQIISGTSADGKYQSVLPKSKLLQIKVSDTGDNITVGDIIKAIEYAQMQGAKVVNCSFELPKFNQELYDSIKDSDMLFVCSAGNGAASEFAYPAAYDLDNVISVAGMNALGAITLSSNYGEWVDIAAPGAEIMVYGSELDKRFITGSSFANAFVTASAAMIWSFEDSLTYKQVKEIILSNSRSNYLLKKDSIQCSMLDISLILNYCTQTYN